MNRPALTWAVPVATGVQSATRVVPRPCGCKALVNLLILSFAAFRRIKAIGISETLHQIRFLGTWNTLPRVELRGPGGKARRVDASRQGPTSGGGPRA